MIAFIRARFPSTPATEIWSDTVAANWMDSAVPFSLAHYWSVSTFQQLDLSHVNFPPVIVNDPGEDKDRTRLVLSVLTATDNAFHPNWDQFDRCIIFFAQATDAFGGGTYMAPNRKLISVAVFDIKSGFDLACQEVGHIFGLRHELGAWYTDNEGNYTNEYGCPYSVMSALGDLTFMRPPDHRLPDGPGPENPQRSVGPYIPTAHLYINQYHAVNPKGVFNHPDSVSYVSATYEHTPVNVRLYARDVAIRAWPNRKTVLVVVPSNVPGGDAHFLELRRRDAAYDGGIGNASIIILAANFFIGNGVVQDPSTLRLRYVDRIDLEAAEGDLDYHSFSGHFVVRVRSSATGFASVDLSIGGGDAWQDFRLTLGEQINNSIQTGTSGWNRALNFTCPIEPDREFNYRVNTYETFFVLQANSAGYEAPGYSWKVQGVPLDPAGSALSLQVSCQDNAGNLMNSPQSHTVQCTYRLNSGRLELSVLSPFAAIVLGIEIAVGETSPSVMKNYYPHRNLWSSVRADNLGIEWDDAYQAALKACFKRLRSLYNQPLKISAPQRDPGLGDPDPQYFEHIGIRETIRILAERDPQAARAVATVVADRTTVSAEYVLEAALRNSR